MRRQLGSDDPSRPGDYWQSASEAYPPLDLHFQARDSAINRDISYRAGNEGWPERPADQERAALRCKQNRTEMDNYILLQRHDNIAVVTLNRPEILNAWHTAMRSQLVDAFSELERNETVRAIILTGAGSRAFSAGQDLNEAMAFDGDKGAAWIGEWKRLYDVIRSLTKPLIAALNGVAAGSAFQVALLCDFRIGHERVRMGQPEVNSGIASVTGPWIMREILGLARTTDLTLSGRLMDATECHSIGIINKIVPEEKVMEVSLSLARELAAKPPTAMRLNKQRLREMTEVGFRECLEAAVRIHREAYGSGESRQMIERFLSQDAS